MIPVKTDEQAPPPSSQWVLVLHGGAGAIRREEISPAREAAIRASLADALMAGAGILNRNGSALDAVEKVAMVMEDDPLFNAGRGAVFNAEGEIELDASIMDGATLRAAAVAGVRRTRNPVALARAVMEKTPHVMLIGDAADRFAKEHGLEQAEPGFFFTERRWQELIQQLRTEGRDLPPRPLGAPSLTQPLDSETHIQEFGTVGAVALDRCGNLAAATSTGGVRAKLPGRVGDSAIIGAGTFASNMSCAVSGTGAGEIFIRLGVAHELSALMRYRKKTLQEAANEIVHHRLRSLGGDGGVIAVTCNGEAIWCFKTPGMHRARMVEGGKAEIAIFQNEQTEVSGFR